MGNKTRHTANLVSDNNLFVDIANDRVGIGSTQPTAKLNVAGIVSATEYYGSGANLTGIVQDLTGKANVTISDNPPGITTAHGDLWWESDTAKGHIYYNDGSSAQWVEFNPSGGGGGGALNNIVEDPTPQLGGNLDLFGKNINGTGDINITGDITATSFVGDGSGLTGVIGSGSGIVIQHDGSNVGTAGTINFSTNLDVTPIFSGIVTVTASGGGGGGISTHDVRTNSLEVYTGVSTFVGYAATYAAHFKNNIFIDAGAYAMFGNSIDKFSIRNTTGKSQLISGQNGGNVEILSQQSGSFVKIGKYSGGANDIALFTVDAGVELFHNTDKKFETTSTGANVTGILTATSIVKSGGTSSQYLMADGSVSTGSGGSGITTANINADTLTVNGDVNFDSATSGLGVFYDKSADAIKILEDGSDKTKLIIGDDSSFTSYIEMYHDGGNSGIGYINYTGTQKLILSGSQVVLMNKARTEEMVQAVQDAGVYLYHNGNQKFETTSGGVTVTGTATATTFSGSGASLTNLPAGQLTGSLPAIDGSALTNISSTHSDIVSVWTIGASGNNHYTFTGPGLTGAENDPTIYLVRGQTYRFTNNSGGNHPFQIKYSNNGSAYTDGITYAGGGSSASSGNIDWNVQFDTPDVLYYQCNNHGLMFGKIIILGDVVNEGSWSASAGSAQTIDTITGVANNAIKTAEYTIHIENGSNMQAQKVLVMQDGTTAFSQEYAIMHKSGLLVSMSATISGGDLLLQATPETGVSGTTTYKVTRQTMR